MLIDGFCVADLPIARRSSLHWFLEKRQDRYAAFVPFNSFFFFFFFGGKHKLNGGVLYTYIGKIKQFNF